MRKLFSSAVVLVLALLVSASAMGQINRPTGMPENSKAFGKTYGEWSAAWWKWALQMPTTAHPLYDSTDCSAGQTGNVWFLGGKFCASQGDVGCIDPMHVVAKRTCTIPHGTALFFPVLNSEDSYVEEASFGNPGANELYLRTAVKNWSNPGDGFMTTATVDGWPMHIVRICSSAADYCLPAESPVFTYTLPNHHNILAAMGENIDDGVTSSAVSDGFYVLIPPLPTGKHAIAFYGANWSFSLDVTYDILVK